ncbi:MAG: DUF6382 domain-containing protein [Blautia sp.]
MGNITIEKHGSGRFLCYQLEESEQIDEFEYGMIRNNTINGLVPVVVSSVDGITVFKYDIAERMSLNEQLNTALNKKDFLSLIKSLQTALQDLSSYMLKTDHVLVTYDHIFVDSNSKEIGLIFIPTDMEEDELDIGLFLKNLIFEMKYDENENNAYIFEIINYLNSKSEISCAEFGKLLDKIMASGVQKDIPKAITNINKISFACEEPGLRAQAVPEVLNKNTFKPKKTFGLFGKKEEKGKKVPDKKKSSSPLGIKIPGMENSNFKIPVSNGNEESTSENPRLINVKNNDLILLDKNRFRLGRKKDVVDYCIQGNKTVGRNHADIIKNEMGYCIIDNNSKNHTYVNGKMLTSGIPAALKHKDRITLSNEEFVFYLYEIE